MCEYVARERFDLRVAGGESLKMSIMAMQRLLTVARFTLCLRARAVSVGMVSPMLSRMARQSRVREGFGREMN